MKLAYLYCDPRSLNDATLFYVNIIEECLTVLGYKLITVSNLSDINSPDLIFTITSVNYVKAKLKFPFVKTITWRQGLGYAEAKMTRPFYKWFPFYLCEVLTVHTANVLFYVSEQMNEYYKKYFFYHGNRHIVMPCYNLPLAANNSLERYNNPNFVYAGGVDKWQGIEELLDIYSIIESEIPNASLTMYARNKEYLLNEASKRNIKNFTVKYVPLDKLQEELSKYKYGFILRQKNSVNYVATPTKMNSYLAAYLIPIFSNGVGDFERHIILGEFTLMAKTPLNKTTIAQQIIDFECKGHDFSKLSRYVESIFNSHYNTERYKSDIISTLERLIK